MTPVEISLYVEVYSEKRQNEYSEMVQQAYLTAYLGRVKQMPTLKKLLKDFGIKSGNAKPKKPMSAEHMLEIVKILNTAFGGNTIEKEGE